MPGKTSSWKRSFHWYDAVSTTAIYRHRVNSAQMAAQEKFLEAIKMTSAAG
jgi:hypothetical protein